MIKADVNFNKPIREWDGFGVNYVETCQTEDYDLNPQDYGGFSTLSEEKRQEILELIFGEEGLKPGTIKMFFDGFHQKENNLNPADITDIDEKNYDHTKTSHNTVYFAKEGYKKVKSWGGDLSIVTTLYGPPSFMTKQKFVRGRDLDEKYTLELAKYMVSWVKYLRETESLPVDYISLHNEGEDYVRWPEDGSKSMLDEGHDYNMYWPPELVSSFLPLLRTVLDDHNLHMVGTTPGECTNWYRFDQWGYADAIADNKEAMKSLGLITSHAFVTFNNPHVNRWFGDTRSIGIDTLRQKNPDLHAWGTSISWNNMDVDFLNFFRHNIYSVKVNALIPWACIQNPTLWEKGDPNPGCAFTVDGKGGYEIQPGYFYYKLLSRAGQRGMHVCKVHSNDSQIGMFAFSRMESSTEKNFVVLNLSEEDKDITINIEGYEGDFKAFRTSVDEQYIETRDYLNNGNNIIYRVPRRSATAFFSC